MVGSTAAAVLMGGAGASAGMSIMAGNANAKNIQRQAQYNAQVYEQQAEMIKSKKQIADYQFLRSAAAARGAIVAKTAGKGFMLSGSPLAILADTESQLQFDKAIMDFNLDVEQNYATSGARYTRETGLAQSRLARFTGYSNAFSTILNTGATAATLNLQPKLPYTAKGI